MNIQDVMSQEKFYRCRDDRTDRLISESAYHQVTCALVTENDTVQSYAGQTIILTAANLLSQWCRRVELAFPDAELLPPLRVDNHSTLHERVLSEMNGSDPFGDFSFSTPSEDSLILQVGPEEIAGFEVDFQVWVEGWEAIGWTPSDPCYSPDDPFPSPFIPAAQLTACLGVAQLFKLAIGQSKSQHLRSYRWDLWNHELHRIPDASPEVQPDVPDGRGQNPGNVLQIGIGAVGSNVLYFMALAGLQTPITLVDHDVVEVANLNRSLLFDAPQAVPPQSPKVLAAQEKLDSFGWHQVHAHQELWEDFSERINSGDFDLWLPLANENDAWYSMAFSYPPVVIHGTTSHDWGFYLGRHIPLVDDCLGCRFPPGAVSHKFTCSEGTINEHDEKESEQAIDASLPFLSAAAASLVVGEILKASLPSYADQPNYVEANLQNSMDNVITLSKPPDSSCTPCEKRSPDLWQRYNRSTQYAELSLESTPSSVAEDGPT